KMSFPKRAYYHEPGFSHLLGYTSAPAKDSAGFYWQDRFIGKDGVEKYYDEKLTGQNGVKITETDAVGKVQSENIVLLPIEGEDIILTIDSRIQKEMYKAISEMAHNVSFQGGSGLIMDIQNGELLSIVNYPEYDSNILSEGKDREKINSFLDDKGKVFLNRSISGLYSPGSIVKPFLAYGALEEEIITPEKEILANGTISIPNPYYPELKSVFKDHGIFGYVDMRKAISVSSDIYFYEIGGGFEDQQGLGILKIDEYSKMFGIGLKTGIDIKGEQAGLIPDPEWKARVFDGDPWRVGDTYNTAIGQYGFQVTPIQMVKAVAGLANKGKLFTPHILKDDNKKVLPEEELLLDEDKLKVIFEGMRMAVTEGTCLALNTPEVEVSAKSGTAQVGFGNTNTNSWIIGFFPYQKPRYAFALVMERGPKSASGNATWVMRQVIDFMVKETPEYFD
nr:penicillin-binding transpeptidase domain-containing protein [Candidatus Paceibacterota bacterium]